MVVLTNVISQDKWINKNVKCRLKKVYVFGTGKVLDSQIKKMRAESFVDIRGFIDNDSRKWHNKLYGKEVIAPHELKNKDFDGIVIASYKFYDDILSQLILLGISEWSILTLNQIYNEAICNTLPGFRWCDMYIQRNDLVGDVSIYVVSHKEFPKVASLVSSKCNYELFYVGAQASYLGEKNNCLYDGMGNDNIAYVNLLINECTAIYWIWKNSKSSIVGINHYRRFWCGNLSEANKFKSIISSSEVRAYLSEYDIIVAQKNMCTGYSGVYKQLCDSIDASALKTGLDIIYSLLRERQPQYIRYFEEAMEGCIFYPCNMFATRKEIFDEYCEWLFSFIVDAAKRIDVSNYDDYSKRVIGFFAERMLTVWLMAHNYKIKTLPMVLLDDSELVEEQKCDE